MLLIALVAGSIGGGISIVLSGERVQLVKHQQLASGASRLAYWTANFIVDSSVMLFQLLILTITFAIVSKGDYSNEGAGVVISAGLLWLLNCVFRFYCFSFAISEVRAAQTFYFYGSLLSMYVVCTFYVIMVMNGSNGNVNTPLSRTTAAIVAALDPTAGFGLVIFYQKNFLGARSTNGDVNALSNDVAGIMITVLGLTVIAYFVLFVFFEMGLNGVLTSIKSLLKRVGLMSESSISESLLAGSMNCIKTRFMFNFVYP
jgi:hypothetical protein